MSWDVEGASCTAIAAWDMTLFLSHDCLFVRGCFSDAPLMGDFPGAINLATGIFGEPRNPIVVDTMS